MLQMLKKTQMKDRKSTDYEFVAITNPNEEGVYQLSVKILGSIKQIPLKKTEKGFRMFSTEDQLKKINEAVTMSKQMNEVFLSGINLINSGELTKENFKEKMEKYQ